MSAPDLDSRQAGSPPETDQVSTMDEPDERSTERNLGEQPLEAILIERELSAHDLVAASTEQITHKMVARARRGRRLSPHVQRKIRNALVAAAGREYRLTELFNYR